jgi:Cof subfamily protein (haloacid dehalogenase superfamily)
VNNLSLKNIKLIATDLDGTFLKNDKTISLKNLEALQLIGKQNIIRVAATGRNLRKVKEVLNDQIPFDFIVYSSGAGVFDWKAQKQIINRNMDKESVRKLFRYFILKDINFHAFFPVPENHKHWFFRGQNHCEEFERYFGFNNAFSYELNTADLPETECCQFLVIIKEDGKKFAEMKKEIETICSNIRVIRTSSPITNGFIWIEVFHQSVSKGNGIKHICEIFNINREDTIGIGNDYNDFDLLEFTGHSFLTENAPEDIKNSFPNLPSNEKDAFAFAAQLILC